MSSVKLFQTDNDGDVEFINGQVVVTSGLDSTVYLSLFGGNEDDSGSEDNPAQWWGNIGESVQYRSETQYLLRSIPATLPNISLVRRAVERDLQWLLDMKIASSIEVSLSLSEITRLSISVTIVAEGEEKEFNFVENWKASV